MSKNKAWYDEEPDQDPDESVEFEVVDEAEGFEDVDPEDFGAPPVAAEPFDVDEPEFDEEDLDEFGELIDEEEEEEPEPEPEPEPVAKNQNGRKCVVTSLTAFVYPDTDVFTKPVAGVSRGNMLMLNDEEVLVVDEEDEWLNVQVPTVDGPIDGFIQKVRVKVL